jgi:hypothetical protein
MRSSKISLSAHFRFGRRGANGPRLLRIYTCMSDPMQERRNNKSVEEETVESEEMVNDSLGTIDSSDSTGLDETKETGDAKRKNHDTGRED